MTGVKDSSSLMRFFEQLAAVQCRLGDQRVVIVGAKDARRLQRRNDGRYGLQLRSALADALFIDDKGLNEKLVRQFFQAAFVRDLSGEEKQAKTDIRSLDLVVEYRNDLMDEFEHG